MARDAAQLRLHLAAGRRILEREGAGSAAFGVLAVRHPERPCVLCTPTGAADTVGPDDIVELEANATSDLLPAGVSRAAGIALAILRRRADVTAVVHTHSQSLAVLSTTRDTVGMYNEMSTLFFDDQAVAEDDGDRSVDACERLAGALGERRVLVLPAHGMVGAAATLADAVIDAIAIEKAAAWDLAARAYGGSPIVQQHIDQIKPLYGQYFRRNMWTANLRRLRRDEPELFAAAEAGG